MLFRNSVDSLMMQLIKMKIIPVKKKMICIIAPDKKGFFMKICYG